ncbi:MAG: NUDIX domain-containing protein [Candidatus Babeliaceae bacterium]
MQKFPFVAGLFIKDNQVLLSFRQNTGFLDGCYTLPGGKVELGESLRAAMVREMHEELGVQISPDDISLAHILSFKNEIGTESVAVYFLIKKWQGELINKEPEKHAEIRWFPLDQLPENLSPRFHHGLTMIKKGILYSEYGW